MSEEIEQEAKKVQSRVFSVILYEDAENYDCMEVIAACCEYFDKWAYAKHDRDTLEDGSPKKVHYHVTGHLEGPRTPQTVANRIGVPANYVQCKKGYTFKKGVRYLLHLDNPEKAQYAEDVISASCEISGYINPYCDDSLAALIYEKISQEGVFDVDEMVSWCLRNNCYKEFRKGFFLWKELLRVNKEKYNRERMR